MRLHLWFVSFNSHHPHCGEWENACSLSYFVGEIGAVCYQGWAVEYRSCGFQRWIIAIVWSPVDGSLLYPSLWCCCCCLPFFKEVLQFIKIMFVLFYLTCHLDIQRIFRSGPQHPQPRVCFRYLLLYLHNISGFTIDKYYYIMDLPPYWNLHICVSVRFLYVRSVVYLHNPHRTSINTPYIPNQIPLIVYIMNEKQISVGVWEWCHPHNLRRTQFLFTPLIFSFTLYVKQ